MSYFLAILEQFSGSLFIFFFKKERKEVPVQGSPHSHPWIVFILLKLRLYLLFFHLKMVIKQTSKKLKIKKERKLCEPW